MSSLLALAAVLGIGCGSAHAAAVPEFAAIISSVTLDPSRAEADVEVSQRFDEFGGAFRDNPGSLHVVDKATYLLLARSDISAGDHALVDCRRSEVRQGKEFLDRCVLKKLGTLKGHLAGFRLNLPQNPAPSEFDLEEKAFDIKGKGTTITYLARLIGNASNDSFSDYKNGDELICEVHQAELKDGKVRCALLRNASLEARRETERREALAKQERDRLARLDAERKDREALQAAQAKREADRLQRVAQWRAMKTKPPLPPQARRFRVLAEDAVHEKRFAEAADFYEQALAVEPLWPQGQFNLALLRGEMKRYGEAVSHMQRYLELVPDAPDAQAAGDKIILWEEKAKNPAR